MTSINTQDRLFGLLQINPLSVFRSHQVLVLNAYHKYTTMKYKKIVRKSIFYVRNIKYNNKPSSTLFGENNVWKTVRDKQKTIEIKVFRQHRI
jgi:hypothetical protein